MAHPHVTEVIEPNDHETISTIKVRFHPETDTYRAYVRVGEQRSRSRDHGTVESLAVEVTAMLITLTE